MPFFRKKPVVVEAHRWRKNGDHPQDAVVLVESGEPPYVETEGKVVRRFRPDVNGDSCCRHCSLPMREHGWIDTLEDGHVVCPGDWIITGVHGEHYPCKRDIFEETYTKVAD